MASISSASTLWKSRRLTIMAISLPFSPRTSCSNICPCLRSRMDKMPALHSDITTRLAAISDTPDLDASVLIAHILNKPRTWVMAHPELTLTTEQQKQLDDSLTRLEKGEPFPYVLGHWEF